MWKVLRYIEKDIVDEEGYIIYPAKTWYEIGRYDTIDSAANVVKHEIYLYNCDCREDVPAIKIKIESNFE